MNQTIKRQWVQALRSGEYEQGRAYLHTTAQYTDSDVFCCLGVLCDLAHQAGIVERRCMSNSSYSYIGEPVDDYSEVILPDSVKRWANLDSEDPEVDYEGHPEGLASLNDSAELSFDEIANLIEEQL